MASRWRKLAKEILAPNAQTEVRSAWLLTKAVTNKNEYSQALEAILSERHKLRLKHNFTLHPSTISRLVAPLRTFKLDVLERCAFIDSVSLLGPIPSKLLADLYFDQDDYELAASRLSPEDLGSNVVLNKIMSTGAAIDICELLGPESRVAPEIFHLLMDQLYQRKEYSYMAKLWQSRHKLCPELRTGYTEALKHYLLVAAVESNDETLLATVPKPAGIDKLDFWCLAEMLDNTGQFEYIPAASEAFPCLRYKDFPLLAQQIAEGQARGNILAVVESAQSTLLANIVLYGIFIQRDLELLWKAYCHFKSVLNVFGDIDTACIVARANLELGSELSALELWTEFVVENGIVPNQRFMELLISSEVRKRNLHSAILFLKEMRRRNIYVRQKIRTSVQEKTKRHQSTETSLAMSTNLPLLAAHQQFTADKQSQAKSWLKSSSELSKSELRKQIETHISPR